MIFKDREGKWVAVLDGVVVYRGTDLAEAKAAIGRD